MSWIATKLFGLWHVLGAGIPLPDRPSLDFLTGFRLPGTMPTVTIRRVPSTGTAATVGRVATDISANVAAYEAVHNRTASVGGGGYTVDRTAERYHVNLTAEDGANSITGAKFIFVSCTWIRPAGSRIGQD